MSNSSNHYYELPFEMIENIESYLKIKPQEVEEMETEIKNAPRKVAYETSVREFKNFLSLIKSRI